MENAHVAIDRGTRLGLRRESLGVAIVLPVNSGEFCATASSTCALRDKVPVRNGVVLSNASMRSVPMKIFAPSAIDLIQEFESEADEALQAFSCQSSNEAFAASLRR